MANILIIEDEPVVWALLQRIIKEMGHQVDVANDGQKGLDMAVGGQYAVIVSDLHMPGAISGMDLLRRLRAARPQCPIVVVSGYPSPEAMSECERLGIRDFLTKPFEMTFVRTIVEKILKDKAAAGTVIANKPL
jgi:DNA-binding NtrC family response regulator